MKIRRFDTDCFVHVIDLKKTAVKLTYGFSTVTDAAVNHKASLGINGGGWGLWNNKSLPNEYLVVEGVVKQDKSFDGRPCIEITKDNKILFHERPNLSKAWNIFGFDRFIARHGEFNDRISDRTSVAPRTVYGSDIRGNLVVLVCEGRQADQKGLTFPEIWEVMKEFDVTDCGNADGGYSSAVVENGKLLNSTYLLENPPRKVVHQVLFFDTQTPPEVPSTPLGVFGMVKDDFEINKLSRPTRNLGRTKRGWGSANYVRGLPMVQPYNGVEPSLLDNEMIEFILRFQPSMGIENQLSNLIGLFDPDRAFNNFQSFHFAIEEDRIVNKLKTKYYPVLCGRAMLKLFSRTPVRFKGVMSYPFEIINTALPYSHFNPTEHPWLFFSPINSVREPIFNPKGKWTGMYTESLVEPFHWFNGDTKLPIHGRGSNVAYIAASLVKILN